MSEIINNELNFDSLKCTHCSCDESSHSHKHEENINKLVILRFSIGTILFIIAIIFNFSFWIELSLYFTSYILIGGKVLFSAFKNLLNLKLFDENFLMSIATIGAFAIKEFPEAVAVMLFYQIGEFFQDLAVNRTKNSISSLMDIRPDYANLKIGETISKVSPNQVKINDIILIKPGEKIPLDGIIIEGSSTLDTSALTGESLLKDVEIGDEVLSGSINKNGLLIVQVTKDYSESTVSKILELVQDAASHKAPLENFITKFAKYYTPIIVFSALLLAFIPPIFISEASFNDWIHRALVFLVVSCPCALVISVPLSFFGGIGGASKNGILIKGSNYLEALNNIHTVVFDKTGTLTKGTFKITQIIAENKFDKFELLEYAAYAESFSNHPIAQSIMKEYGKEIDQSKISNYNEIPGYGVQITLDEKTILLGNHKLMKKENIQYNEFQSVGSIIYIAIDGIYSGLIEISDEIKKDSKKTITALKELGIKRIVMLTGDRKSVGEKLVKDLDIDLVYSELLPYQKVKKLEALESTKTTSGNIVFIGDGINDAPVLARADIGIAMGALGSDAAIEASDVVLMTDEPSKLITAIKIAKKTKKIVWQNIIFSLAVKIIVLILGVFGVSTIWEAVFADVGVALLAILNSIRAMK